MTHNCGLEPAINWMMEHAEDDDIDTPLTVPPVASAEAAGQMAAAGHPQTSQPVVGVPTDASLVVHPDGRAAPAHVVGVQGETKVRCKHRKRAVHRRGLRLRCNSQMRVPVSAHVCNAGGAGGGAGAGHVSRQGGGAVRTCGRWSVSPAGRLPCPMAARLGGEAMYPLFRLDTKVGAS
jgi:hypothetical protein